MDVEDARTIGARARMIRRRRGLSLDVVAGFAGISTPYLSMLERGQRGFNRRGLIEDLAETLACSVVDLTGQPYDASAHRDQARYHSAGRNLSAVLLELQSHVHAGKSTDRLTALAALVDAWMIAAAARPLSI
ncbi:MAG: helix-turn-helix domain-containing protein, partial [Gammaproteobacteria bacterium]